MKPNRGPSPFNPKQTSRSAGNADKGSRTIERGYTSGLPVPWANRPYLGLSGRGVSQLRPWRRNIASTLRVAGCAWEGEASRTDHDCPRSLRVEWSWSGWAQILRICIVLLPQFGVESRQPTCERLRHWIGRSRRLDRSSLHSREGGGKNETESAEKEVMAHDGRRFRIPTSVGGGPARSVLVGVRPRERRIWTHREAYSRGFWEQSGSLIDPQCPERRCVSTRT